jgi:hypothetical protein
MNIRFFFAFICSLLFALGGGEEKFSQVCSGRKLMSCRAEWLE